MTHLALSKTSFAFTLSDFLVLHQMYNLFPVQNIFMTLFVVSAINL